MTPTTPFLAIGMPKNWVRQEYGVDIKYQRIREYLIQHFKTKLGGSLKSKGPISGAFFNFLNYAVIPQLTGVHLFGK